MGLLLFRVCLVINAFNIATENPVTTKPYRFPVYPVNECPRSKDEFKTAAQRRNCTKGLRYLCAPNKYLSSLIEFCTDRQIGLYQEGNCVILEGTGDLDHYSCVEKFNSSCPLEFYNDEEIYKYPACLQIDRELRCFAADNGCKKRKFHITESNLNISKMETVGNETFRGASRGWLAIGYIIATAAVLAVIILSWIIFQKRKREQVEKCKDNSENETLLKDNPEIDDDKLRQFLSKGEITVCHVRCIIVGCAKAGKTTLLKRLQNVSFDELMQIERTEMVDFHVNSFDVLLEEETIKSVEKEDTLPTILFSKEKLEMPLKENDGKMAKETHQPGVEKEDTLPTILFSKEKLKENDGKMAKETHQPENIPMVILKNQANNDNAENEEKLIFEPHSQDTTLVQNQFSPEPNEKHGEDIDANVDKIDFEKFAILKIKDAVNELLNEKELRPRITFLDFAGQSMYYAFHQIFLRPKSCSILVVDMTKSLYDKVGDQDENEKECSRFASWRYKDYYKFWLKSIDSFSDTESPVIIVVTHADKLSKEECRQFLKSLKDLFDNWSHSGLRRHLNEDRMYTIGFPDSGSELEDLKDLKKCIANIVKCPRYSKENIRPVWALFEHILNKMKETEKVIPRKTLSDYSDQLSAQEFRMDESEISKMLVFFHRVGVLLYFDKDGLKEKIILDIQWLLDAFKCIIEYPVRTEENDMKRKHFRRTGELDDVELDRIWHVEGKDFLKHKTTIIAYMQQLGLLMPLKELHSIDSPVYYFPSMNSKRFDKTGEHNSKSSILCFKFDDEMQLPINVFHGIVLKCSKLNYWSILTEGAKNNICLYQNAACFSFQNHVVVLCNCNFEIRVQVWASPKIYDGRLLKKIKHSVEDIIRGDDLSYKIGYKCRKDVLNVEEDVSFISQSTFPVSNYLCEICDVDNKHVVDNDICWELEVNENKENEEEWPIVVALDFGTTYSGYAFWRKENPSEITTGKWNTGSKEVMESLKIPTSLLLNQDNEVIEFGYKADEIFKELVEDEIDKEYRYFSQFKMMLHNESLLDKKKSISDHLKRPLEALEVFSLSIQYLRDECLRDFDNKRIKVYPDEILWILTVPAIWSESAKQFMRKAAEKAGILSEQLILALEPEAAAIYVMKEAKTVFGKDTGTTFNPGTKIMVADLGGGTADLIVLEVKEDRKMKQLHQSAGGAWGGNLINKKIWEIMAEIFGSNVIENFKKTSDFMEMESIIELRKRDITIGSKLELPIFPSLSQLCKQDYRTLIKKSIYGNSVKAHTGKLDFEPDMVQKIFDLTFTNLFTVVEKVLNHENAVGVNDIILVGGLAQADIIVKQFKEKFSGYKVIVPIDPVLAVLKGAVMFGQDTDIISSRITAHTYGSDAMRLFMDGDPRDKKRMFDNVVYCFDVFHKMVAIGDSVDVGKTVEQEVFASSKEMKSMVLKFYQSEIKNPKYVTDPGCKCIGELSVEMPDLSGGSTERSVMVSIKFGETEITVCGVDKTTGKKQETALDLLGDTKCEQISMTI